MRRAAAPEEVARRALDGAAAGEFLVMTDPVSAGPVRRRLRDVAASLASIAPAEDGR